MMNLNFNSFLAASLNSPKKSSNPLLDYSQKEVDERIMYAVIVTILFSVFSCFLFLFFRICVETRKHNVFCGDYHVIVVKHKCIVQLPHPEKEGYTFRGWYMDERRDRKWPPTKLVDRDLYLYPKWEKNPQ